MMGWVHVGTLILVNRALAKRFGQVAAVWFPLLCASQYAFVHAMTRTVPSAFALALCNIGLSLWLAADKRRDARISRALGWMLAASTVFQWQMAVVLYAVWNVELLRGRIGFFGSLRGMIGLAAAWTVVAIAVDSYMWQVSWMWSEFWACIYAIAVQGVRQQFPATWDAWWQRWVDVWHVAPVAWAIALLGVMWSRHARSYGAAAVAYLVCATAMSTQAIPTALPVLPLANALAAITIASLAQSKKTIATLVNTVAKVAVWISILTVPLYAYTQAFRYPGAHALERLHALLPSDQLVRVHVDHYAVSTGALHFGVWNSSWDYDVTDEYDLPSQYADYTHVITTDPDFHEDWFYIAHVENGLDKWRFRPLAMQWSLLKQWMQGKLPLDAAKGEWIRLLPVDVVLAPKVYLLERKDPEGEEEVPAE
jgi:hypothetical protein